MAYRAIYEDIFQRLWNLAARHNKTGLCLTVRYLKDRPSEEGNCLVFFDGGLAGYVYCDIDSSKKIFSASEEISIYQNNYIIHSDKMQISINKDDISLSLFICKCARVASTFFRKKYKNYSISLKTRKKHEEHWEEMANAYESHVSKFGTSVPSYGKWLRLSQWLSAQRVSYRRNELSPSRILRLEKIGIDWEPGCASRNARWDQMALLYEQYCQEHGDGKIKNSTVFMGERLGSWLHRQRKLYLEGKLNPKRIARLEKIRIDWSSE